MLSNKITIPKGILKILISRAINRLFNSLLLLLSFSFQIFTESKPPVRYKTGGLVIGFSTFGFLIVMIGIGWFCCTRNINTSHRADDKEDEEEKPKTITACPVTGKPHGIKYIA